MNTSYIYVKGQNIRRDRDNWKQCYFKNKSVSYCNKETHYTILDVKFEKYLQEKIELLKQKKLSFFYEVE